jgi:hypothetical protein
VVFQWQPAAPLPEGAFYEVVAWLPGQGPADARGLAAPTAKTSASVNLDVMSSSGARTASELTWTVVIVRTDPYQRLTDASAGEARRLIYGGPPPTQPVKPRG